MNEGSNFLSMGIQAYFSIKDARARRKQLREQAEASQALTDKVAGITTLEPPHAFPEEPYEDMIKEDTEGMVSGISQISAEGKACIPCSSDHFAGVAGMLSESIRFARDGGIEHPEVIKRIAHAQEEIAALEREDGSPDTVSRLPDDERALMKDVLSNCRKFRHIIWDITTVEALEEAATKAQEFHRDLTRKALKMSMARMSPEQQEDIKTRAKKVISQAMEGGE